MHTTIFKFISLTTFSMLLASCGSLNISNPFGSKQAGATPYQGATHYICAENKQFYVRMLNNNQQAWLIYPDHEVGLNRSDSEKNRYTSGVINLIINGDESMLNDGDKITYRSCRPQK